MEFSGQYLTYEEYKALGGTLDLTPFNLLEYEARKKIDGNTLCRLQNVKEIPQEVKICEYNLINSIQKYTKSVNNVSSNGNVKSENIEGYSVSYITPSEIKEVISSKEVELDNIITNDLFGVSVNGEHILYNGI